MTQFFVLALLKRKPELLLRVRVMNGCRELLLLERRRFAVLAVVLDDRRVMLVARRRLRVGRRRRHLLHGCEEYGTMLATCDKMRSFVTGGGAALSSLRLDGVLV